jgi:medium-chain acyl-[acyl-carrier-protein] hydrolase
MPMPATDKTNLWLPVLRPATHARLRLFCFPYAGGSASAYARWPERLPAGVDVRPVQLPGRWNRLREPPLTRFDDVVRAIADVLPPYVDRPHALFGHSMGALLAFEIAGRLRERGLPPPLSLFVSGHRAPQLPDTDLPGADLNDPAFIERLRGLDGTPREVLDSPALMTLLLPTIRADFNVCRSYAYVPGAPLACPITVFGGADDTETADGRLEAWSIHTTARSTVYRFPGGHFYIHSAEALLLKALSASLNALLAADAPLATAAAAFPARVQDGL